MHRVTKRNKLEKDLDYVIRVLIRITLILVPVATGLAIVNSMGGGI